MAIARPAPVWDFNLFTSVLPPYGWIRDYVQYACACTDAPPLYHIISATSIVSAAVAPHLDLSFQGVKRPLHMFFLICGGSSESRKTSAIKRAVEVAKPVFGNHSQHGDRLWWPMLSSPEGIAEELAAEPNRLMLYSEWTELHRQTQASYWKQAEETINSIYDAHDMVRVKAKTKVQIKRPRVTILGASTPSLVLDAVNRSDWLAGKMARYLIAHMTRPPGMEMPTSVDDPMTVNTLRKNLGPMLQANTHGDAWITDAAWNTMQAWQNDPWWLDLKARAPEHIQPSFGRAPEHVFRLATIFAASMKYPWKVAVDFQEMEAAIRLVEWCYEELIKTFSVLDEHNGQVLARVRSIIAAAGPNGIAWPQLLRRSNSVIRPVREALEALEASGAVQKVQGTYRFIP